MELRVFIFVIFESCGRCGIILKWEECTTDRNHVCQERNSPIYSLQFKFLKFFDVFNGYQGNRFNISLTYYDVMLQFLFFARCSGVHSLTSFSGHSRELVDGHAQFMQGVKPVVGYNGSFGYRRNVPWLRAVTSPFGASSRSPSH